MSQCNSLTSQYFEIASQNFDLGSQYYGNGSSKFRGKTQVLLSLEVEIST